MGHLLIHCDGCGSDWTVYHRDDWKNWKARTCPVCGKSIEPGTWDRQILRAFGEMEDANLELVKDNIQSHGTLFTVSYIPDVVFPNKPKSEDLEALKEEIRDLRLSVDGIKGITERMIDSLFQI